MWRRNDAVEFTDTIILFEDFCCRINVLNCRLVLRNLYNLWANRGRTHQHTVTINRQIRVSGSKTLPCHFFPIWICKNILDFDFFFALLSLAFTCTKSVLSVSLLFVCSFFPEKLNLIKKDEITCSKVSDWCVHRITFYTHNFQFWDFCNYF